MSREAALALLAGADWLATAQPFFACLGGAEGRTRVVGGIVRDTLLGRPLDASDIDMATELLPEDVMARGEAMGLGVHPTGIAHGTITLVHQGHAIEVTTLRRDVETFGRHAKVAFGSDWGDDAKRRDFTMNALYCGPDGALFDPLDGLDDCLAGRVRFLGDPAARIAEDRLRVYRYFRFAASHGGQCFEDEAIAACTRAAGALGALSAERVGGEMMRLLSQPKCAVTLEAMVAAGVLADGIFTPDALAALRHLERLPVGVDAEMRLAVMALIGLPVERLRRIWRLSNATMGRVAELSSAGQLAKTQSWAELSYRYPNVKMDGAAVAAAAQGLGEVWTMKALAALAKYGPVVFPISGADLVAVGMQPGPELGTELKRLERIWIEAGFNLDRTELLGQARRL